MNDIQYRLPQKRALVTELPGPKSAALTARRRAAVAAGVGSSVPVYAADADGGVVVDVDGNSLIDLGSGIAVTSVGASNSGCRRGGRGAGRGTSPTPVSWSPPTRATSASPRQLAALTPGDHEKRTVLFNSGAEAVENAIKVARLATGRTAVVAFDHAYHGRTNLTMALTAKSMPYKAHFGPFAPEVYRMPMSYPYRDEAGLTGEQAAQRAISQIEKQIGADSVAAIIIEPIQGEGGFIVPAPGFLPTLVELGDAPTASSSSPTRCRPASPAPAPGSRASTRRSCPDIITMAKGIAGGMPLAAITGRADLLDAVHPGGLGGTYGGNPVACAAALAAIDTHARSWTCRLAPGTSRRPRAAAAAGPGRRGRRHRRRARPRRDAGDRVRQARHRPSRTPDLTKAIAAQALAQGVIVLTCGTYGNVIRLLPPLVIGDDLLARPRRADRHRADRSLARLTRAPFRWPPLPERRTSTKCPPIDQGDP